MRIPYRWKQGEHVAVIGRTGSGKSMLLSHLLSRRTYRIIVRTKPDEVEYPGTETVSTLERIRPGRHAYELEPEYARQRIEIWKTLDFVWQTGGWCIAFDELFYLIDSLQINVKELGSPIDKLLTQGRSKGITVVSGMQRPARITRFAISEATHVLSFAVEGREAKTIGEATNAEMERTVQRLGRYEFAWYYAPERSVWTGRYNIDTGELQRVDTRQTART